MKRPKNFLILVIVLSVAAIGLATALHAMRQPRQQTQTTLSPAESRPVFSPAPVTVDSPKNGAPSAAAQKRAKDFNDATSRFNAPDSQ